MDVAAPPESRPVLSARTLLAAALGRGDGLVPNSGLRDLLRSTALPATLDGTSIPAHVVATDLGTGAAVVLSGGPTGPALLASCAFPGLYPPVEVDGRLWTAGCPPTYRCCRPRRWARG